MRSLGLFQCPPQVRKSYGKPISCPKLAASRRRGLLSVWLD
jgi:hypothetical protein